MKKTITLFMMIFVLGATAQQKREYLNVIDSVSSDSSHVHYQKYTKKVYERKGIATLDQVTVKIANLVQDSINCEDAIVPLKARYLVIKNNAELDSLSRDIRLNNLEQRYNVIQDELDDIEMRKIQEHKLFDAF